MGDASDSIRCGALTTTGGACRRILQNGICPHHHTRGKGSPEHSAAVPVLDEALSRVTQDAADYQMVSLEDIELRDEIKLPDLDHQEWETIEKALSRSQRRLHVLIRALDDALLSNTELLRGLATNDPWYRDTAHDIQNIEEAQLWLVNLSDKIDEKRSN